LVGLGIYFSKTGFIKPPVKENGKELSKPQQSLETKPSGQGDGEMHQTHAMAVKEQEKEEKVTEENPTVEIPKDKQQLIGVKTAVVAVKSVKNLIRTVGRVEYDEKRLATVNTKVEGWIERLYVDYTGRYVKKGEPLAEVYSPELVATQQEFLNMLRWSKQSSGSSSPDRSARMDNQKSAVGVMLSKDAETMVEAAKQRLRLWDISEEQIRKIEDSGQPVRTLTLYSPVNGFVVQKMVLKGTRVMPGEKLFDIVDLSTVWIISDIYEYELPMIKVGESAKITLSYFPGREFSSVIDYVYPTIAAETRTAKVRFSIPNPGGQLKPQMFTNVEVKIDLGKKLVIPDDAVIDTGVRQIVYVDKGEGLFEPREVDLGIRAEGFREVLKGLKAGEKVASSATFLIDSEAQLKGVRPLEGHTH
ncbi:MAG TPA: efflux RND transporter periplasmic adaptor subunit, partial [Thermodesulfovibrionales bacterium]|nr:efflux RND transporter periplasmic adaptor subunit [Thermodesulfovibrionales bacterium]